MCARALPYVSSAQEQEGRIKPLSETAPGKRILSRVPKTEADFTPTPAAHALLSKRGEDGARVGRFMPNPDEWGPGSKATSHASFDSGGNTDAATVVASQHCEADASPDKVASSGSLATSSMQQKRARLQGKRTRKRQAQAPDHEGTGRARDVEEASEGSAGEVAEQATVDET